MQIARRPGPSTKSSKPQPVRKIASISRGLSPKKVSHNRFARLPNFGPIWPQTKTGHYSSQRCVFVHLHHTCRFCYCGEFLNERPLPPPAPLPTKHANLYLLAGFPAVEGIGVVLHEECQVLVRVLIPQLDGSRQVPQEGGNRFRSNAFEGERLLLFPQFQHLGRDGLVTNKMEAGCFGVRRGWVGGSRGIILATRPAFSLNTIPTKMRIYDVINNNKKKPLVLDRDHDSRKLECWSPHGRGSRTLVAATSGAQRASANGQVIGRIFAGVVYHRCQSAFVPYPATHRQNKDTSTIYYDVSRTQR